MFDDPFKPNNIKIPAKLVNGNWEFFYGGPLPIKDGAIADLTVDESTITNKEFLKLIKNKNRYKILNEGTELKVALTIKHKPALDEKLRSYLTPINTKDLRIHPIFHKCRLSPDSKFISIKLGSPTDSQISTHNEKRGGLWLDIQGLQPKGLISSTIDLPGCVANEPAISLNHAFTLLSQAYEPWRKSHTGNIYTRMFYKEKNNFWYPLEALRDTTIAKEEDDLIKGQWKKITEELNLNL